MSIKINTYLLEFALNSLLRQKSKTFFISFIFTTLIFLLSSVFFITNSMKWELNATIDSLPQIIVQSLKAGRHVEIERDKVEPLLLISGVSDARARVWGYYYFEREKKYFTLVGVDEFETPYRELFVKSIEKLDFSSPSMYVGLGVKQLLESNYFKDSFNFIKADGTLKEVKISAVFKPQTQLESNDIMVMSNDTLRDIFDIKENMATDIALRVANPEEVETIVLKIKSLYPNTNIITNSNLAVSYEKIFNYKGGLFLALFIISIFTFFIIVYDKASGLTSHEKREVGILKAIGWSIDDILKEKFYEAFILSFFSYLLGVFTALFYVYSLGAPLIKNIFIGSLASSSNIELPFIVDFQTLSLVFLLSVPIYIAAVIIPSWRVATLDADEVIR